MIRDFSLADLITLSNGFAGTGSILATLQYMDTRDRRILWLPPAPPLAASGGGVLPRPGTGSILATLQYMDTRDRRILWLAFALPLVAMVFDFLDGRVARWRHRERE